MQKKYKASVIIPTYNRSGLLKLTLITLLNQDVSNEIFEVIVVDDGSTDDTKIVVEEFSNRLNIKYIYQSNNGFRAAAARNLGIVNSEGDICIFIDSGILLSKSAIKKNVKSHSSDVDYAVIGYMYGFDEYNENKEYLLDLNIDVYKIDEYFKILEHDNVFDLRESLYRELGDDLTKWPAPWTVFWTGYLSVKRDNLIKVGMFDENFTSWGGEDIDLGLALLTNNIKIVLNRNLKSIHYPHDKSRKTISKDELKNKRKYIHKKYNLKSTEAYIDIPSKILNQKLIELQIKA